jgi:integrase
VEADVEAGEGRMVDEGKRADVETGHERADEDWVSKASRESNEALAKRAIPGQKSALVRAERAARARAEEAGVHIPANYRRKRAEVLNRRSVKVLGDGKHKDAATPHFYLYVKGKARSYVFRYKKKATGKEVELGLGSAETMDLERARDEARQMNVWLAERKDPAQERNKKPAGVTTVNQVADEYIAKFYGPHIKKSDTHKKNTAGLFENYIRPAIGDMLIGDVTRGTIATAIFDSTDRTRNRRRPAIAGIPEGSFEDLWIHKNQTAALIRMHLINMFDYAETRAHIEENPITSKWFKKLVSQRDHVHEVEHHASVPYPDIYRFLEAVRAARKERSPASLKFWGGPARKCLWLVAIKSLIIEFQVYSGVRHGEIRKARWGEIDRVVALTWTPPAANTKKKLLRPIPLTPQMLRVLEEVRGLTTDHSGGALIFPGTGGKVIGASQMKAFVVRQVRWESDVDPHGARSTFQDWRRAETEYDEVLWKIQVGQQVGNKVEQSYGHDKLLPRRRRMMNEWGEFCDTWPPPLRDSEGAGKVISLPPQVPITDRKTA